MSRDFTRKLMYALSLMGICIISDHSISVCQTKPDSSIVGMWQGSLAIGESKIRIIFHIAKSDSGSWTASLDSPDQGARGIAVSSVILDMDSVKLFMTSIGSEYDGKLSADRSSIDGKWIQSGASLPLSMIRTTVEIKYNRPQEPKPPYPYESEEVSFESKTTGMKYSGTVTIPDSGGPFPAAILITGSGMHDRNEEVFEHKPFLVIADYLTRRGIAVLRVDDRGIGGSTGNKMQSTSVDHAKDVIAEIEYLKNRGDINPNKIGIIGHSEGGMIAPIVASQSKDVSFVVLLAGTGERSDEVLTEQKRVLEKSEGVPDGDIDREINQDENEYRIMRSSSDSATIADSLKEYLRTTMPELSGSEIQRDGDHEKEIDGKVGFLLSPWFRSFIFYDPRSELEKVRCPVLAMDGTLDLQVSPEENLEEIEKALKKGGNADYTIKLMPGLNHLFQDAKTGSPNEYAQIEETFSPEALTVMGDWILRRMEKK
ncbi:MAG TPA: alpha/beta fold hydrolase [Candidatus Acidoferrales bacterium]|nr:alpha/beta fold hydrolase [Candidatus Acidoferrales bacterium]